MERQFLIVWNPTAGKGKAALYKEWLVDELENRQLSYEIFATSLEPDSLKSTLARSFTDIIVIGGDGTLNEVVNQITERQIPIGILPGGTGNDYAKNLDLGTAPKEHIQTAIDGMCLAVDLGRCNNQLFLNGLGVGFDGQIAKHVLESEVWLTGWAEYYYHVLKNLSFFKSVRLKVRLDSRELEDDFFLCTVAKGTTFGGSFRLTPNATVENGELAICLIRKIPVWKRYLNIYRLQNGTHGVLSEVELLTAKQVEISAQSDAVAHLDGEYIGAPPFKIDVLSKAISIRVRR